MDETKSFTGVFIVEVRDRNTQKVIAEETIEMEFPATSWHQNPFSLEAMVRWSMVDKLERKLREDQEFRKQIPLEWFVDSVLIERKQ